MSSCGSVAVYNLVSEGVTDRLYLVPGELLIKGIFEGAKRASDDTVNAVVVDLRTDDVWVVRRSQLLENAIPDSRVGYALREYSIQGIKNPYKRVPVTSDPTEIPFEGNVRNPQWAHILLGGACNSRCTFCYTDWLRKYPNFTRRQGISVITRLARIDTIEMVVFSGGEATINPDFEFLLSYTQAIGFSKIGLQTNGRELRTQEKLEQLTKLGLTSILLSLHGPKASVHDKITGVPGSFSEALQCLNVVNATNVKLTVNYVICQENQDHVLDMVRFMGKTLGNKGTLRFSYPIVEGGAFDNRQSVLVPFSFVRKVLSAAMDLAQGFGLRLQAANMPLCIPDGRYGKTTYDVDVLGTFVQASPFYKHNVARGERSLKLSVCAECSDAHRCRGIQFEYLRAFPDSTGEFVPVCNSSRRPEQS